MPAWQCNKTVDPLTRASSANEKKTEKKFFINILRLFMICFIFIFYWTDCQRLFDSVEHALLL